MAAIFCSRVQPRLHFTDLFGDNIAFRLELLHFGEQDAAFFIELENVIDRGWVHLAVFERRADEVGLFADYI